MNPKVRAVLKDPLFMQYFFTGFIVILILWYLKNQIAPKSLADTTADVAQALNTDVVFAYDWCVKHLYDFFAPKVPDDVVVDNIDGGRTAGYYRHLGYGDSDIFKMFWATIKAKMAGIGAVPQDASQTTGGW